MPTRRRLSSRPYAALARVLAAVLLVLGLALAAPPAAHAAADVVRNLDTTYDIQADGTVKVRQQFDWHFGSTGRHGIQLGLAIREAWDADPTKEVRYEISNIEVDSPTGAPDLLTQSSSTKGDVDTLLLQVGDPNQTVQGLDHTYVLSYDLRGALRTFVGVPELFWDVTSQSFPNVDSFTVRVSAPGGVQQARCLVGADECFSMIENGVATFSGTNARSGRTLSVVAGLKAGAVRNTQPILERRRVTRPELLRTDADVTYLPGGTLRVEQRMRYLLPARSSRTVTWDVPARRAFSRTEDAVYPIENLTATAGGEPLQVWDNLVGRDSTQTRRITAQAPAGDSPGAPRTITLSYDVRGAVAPGPDGAVVAWPFPNRGTTLPMTLTYRTPARPLEAGCSNSELPARASTCGDLQVETLTDGVRYTAVDPTNDPVWGSRIVLPAEAAGEVVVPLEPSLDHRRQVQGQLSWVGAFGGFGLLAAAGWASGRRRVGPDQRFADVPPGVVDGPDGAVVAARTAIEVPVRFTPPDLPPAEAGALLERRYRPTQLAATIVQLAVAGAIDVRTNPLVIRRANERRVPDGWQVRIYEQATRAGGGTAINDKRLSEMAKAARRAAEKTLSGGPYVVPNAELGWARALRLVLILLLVFGVGAALIALLSAVPILPEVFGSGAFMVALACGAGLILGLFLGRSRAAEMPLSATGTALREQTIGFRRYIETAEAGQLDFEADSDIFTRYLPWAVLFGLTERWTRVCQQLVDAGRIPELDTSLLGAQMSTYQLTSALSSLATRVSRASTVEAVTSTGSSFFSGGGSGGSSGFSGGSSGGGGGGGTSASSW